MKPVLVLAIATLTVLGVGFAYLLKARGARRQPYDMAAQQKQAGLVAMFGIDVERESKLSTADYQLLKTWQLIGGAREFDGKAIELVDYAEQGTIHAPELLDIELVVPRSRQDLRDRVASLRQREFPTKVKVRGVCHFSGPGIRHDLRVLVLHSLEVLSEPPDYRTVTLAGLTEHPDQFDRMKVEYTGVYNTSEEGSWIDRKIWYEGREHTVWNGKRDPTQFGWDKPGVKVRVRGILYTAWGFYGHMNQARYLIRPDEVSVVE